MTTPPTRCRAHGCDKTVPAALLFCNAHWKLVPRELRKRWGKTDWGRRGAVVEKMVAAVQVAETEKNK